MGDREEVREPGLPDGYRCDSCAEPAPVWLFPTRTHAVYELQDDHDETLVTGMSQGGWLACAACRTFIERIRSEVDRERFARRCATVIANKLRIPPAWIIHETAVNHPGLLERPISPRTGPASHPPAGWPGQAGEAGGTGLRCAVSDTPPLVGSIPGAQASGFPLSPHSSRAVFAKNRGCRDPPPGALDSCRVLPESPGRRSPLDCGRCERASATTDCGDVTGGLDPPAPNLYKTLRLSLRLAADRKENSAGAGDRPRSIAPSDLKSGYVRCASGGPLTQGMGRVALIARVLHDNLNSREYELGSDHSFGTNLTLRRSDTRQFLLNCLIWAASLRLSLVLRAPVLAAF
jgi:hypothetical protein